MPSRHSRLLAVIAAASAAAALAAGASAAPPTRAELAFTGKLQTVCRAWTQKFAKAPLPSLNSSPKTLAADAATSLALLQGELADIRKLTPPPGVALRVRLLLGDGDDEAAALKKLIAVARTGNLAKAKGPFSDYLAGQASMLERGQAFGATC